MNKYKTVEEFLADQPPEKLEQVNFIRQLIVSAEPSIVENLKWNAPNYVYQGVDRITFNVMNKDGDVKLILHMGTAKKENKNGKPILPDSSGMVAWNSDIRGTISFTDIDQIKARKAQITHIISQWVSINS